jgi:thiol-disulfide isomerase/thioredoxin
MNMRNTTIIFVLLALLSCTTKVNQEMYSNYNEQTIMIGEVNWDGLTTAPYGELFIPNYLEYEVDSVSLKTIVGKLDDIEVVTFMGTWCEDSQQQVPQFYKIMDYLKYDLGKMKVGAINRDENGLIMTPSSTSYSVAHIPAFIFFRNGKELGRISEYPIKTIEKDMVDIISQ